MLDREGSEHKLTPIARIILESGLLNAAFLFAFVMTVVFSSSSLEIMSEMASIKSECSPCDSADVLCPLSQGTPMCGIVFSIVIFRVGLRRRNRFQRESSGEPSMNWAAAVKSFGTRSRTGPNAVARPPAPALRQSVVEGSATPLRVFVHHTSSRGLDDDVGETWRESMTKHAQVDGNMYDGQDLAV